MASCAKKYFNFKVKLSEIRIVSPFQLLNRVEQSISWDWSVELLKVVVRVENLFNKTRYYWSLADLVLYNVSQEKKKN